MFTEKSFDTGEIKINYADSETSGPPLMLLHGLTSSWSIHWRDFMTPFALKWHVVAPDFRGHGKSGRVADQYRFVDYAKDTIALLRGLFAEPIVLMGHSLGAVTAAVVAEQAPELVRALVLLDLPLYSDNRVTPPNPNTVNWFMFVYDTLESSSTYDDVLAKCRAAMQDAPEPAVHALADQLYPLDSGTVQPPLLSRLMSGVDLSQEMQRITCPALLMRGDWDHGSAMADEDAAFMKANVPHLIDVKIPDGTHMFLEEQKDLTMEHVQKFLQSV